MRISTNWLREWLPVDVGAEALSDRLTQSGLEVDTIISAAGDFSSVVVGKIARIAPHPDASKLSVCEVEAEDGAPVQVVCGADNIYEGMHAPLAMVGARLPGGVKIRKTKLRGVESRGMLCSASELGFGDDHSGILDLHGAGRPGDDLRALLDLDDQVIDVDLTPNRGDCLGMEGIARDLAAAFGADFKALSTPAVSPTCDASLPIEIRSPDSCPRYAGRIIRGIDPDARTPVWMAERLRRGGIRAVSAVVDVTNYVMLELGQPMHAFDLKMLKGGIRVRRAEEGEELKLLDGQTISLSASVTVIADHERALAIAGVMGGEGSGVQASTRDILLESAYFDPLALAGVARSFGLHTDASHRFERGVDPALQERALERATALILEVVGGEPGPLTIEEDQAYIPARIDVRLRPDRLRRLLGADIPADRVEDILKRLGMPPSHDESGWTVSSPTHRFDIAIEEDLIEEIARINGYGEIPETPGLATLQIRPRTEDELPASRLKQLLVSRGYSEAITYSFVDPVLQADLFPDTAGISLANPIAENMSMMRVSLWPGLLLALKNNFSHRQPRIRLFECGMRFISQDDDIQQDNVFSAVIAGERYPEQWGLGSEIVDFFDLKGDVEALLTQSGAPQNFMFNKATCPALHPGRSAAISLAGRTVGWLGELHPRLVAQLEIQVAPQLFEIELDALTSVKLPEIKEVSRFPEIRRDLAILVDEGTTGDMIEKAALADRPEVLKSLLIFDVYRGANIDSGLKSVALGLILQESSRTLTDEDADEVVAAVAARLNKKLGAQIRG